MSDVDQAWITSARNWLDTFDEFAPGLIEGFYVVGSAALGDWQPSTSDIDFVALTAEPADDEVSGTLLTAHAIHTERHPGRAIDGPIIAWGDLVVPPQSIARPWMQDGAFHHDAECFEINPVTWYTLARYGIRMRGPAQSDVPIALDADERVRFVVDNAMSYWRSVHTELAGAIGELAPDATLPSDVPVWCLLGALRMLYSATTADVTSKSGAGRWASGVLAPEFHAICDRMVELRGGPTVEVGLDVLRATEAAMAEALGRMAVLAG